MWAELRATGSADRSYQNLVRTITPGETVLNVGSGDGEVSGKLRTYGCPEVVDIDITDQVRNPALPAATVFNGRHLPYAAESFDVSIAVFVFHHAHTQQRALCAEMVRVTRERIVLIEDTPVHWHERCLIFVHAVVSALRGWGGWCTFRSPTEWEEWFATFDTVTLVESRPASGRWWYPVTRRCFVLEKRE